MIYLAAALECYILRKPTEHILRRFKEGGTPLRRLWYAFAFSAVLFTPVPVMVQQVFQPDAPWYLIIGTALGVLAGAVQFLGLIRWPFLVPSLADIYLTLNLHKQLAIVWQLSFRRFIDMQE